MGGSLQEVVLPCCPETVSLALGTANVLALSDGNLFGASLSLASFQEDQPEPLALRDITPEPVEAGGISVNDFNRHCGLSEELGINLALTNAAADGFPMHFERDTHVRFVKVAAGKHHFAALSSHGILYTWGRGGTWGAGSPLGQGDRKNRSRPTPVGQFVRAGEFVVDVACGATTTCVATSSGRVFSSGAADYGVNGSGMLISSKVFRELEFFRGLLSPKLLEAQRLVEEGQLRELEAFRERFDQEGVNLSHLPMRPFDALQEAPEDSTCKNSTRCRAYSVTGHLGLPKVMCGAEHCGLLTPEGVLWMWGRNDCLQLSKEKSVMASGGESNYPLLVDFFTRSDVPLGSCALGPNHTVALAKNGMVYEWGGSSAESPHPVDLHWSYPESLFKDCVMKVAAGGFSSSTSFSVALTGKGEAFFWGPGASMLPLGVGPAYGHIPQVVNAALPTQKSEQEDDTGKVRIRDIVAGPCGCLLMTTDSLSPCFVR
ncbi:hypothetical protein, conserved [Eimeria tenella]|uniref:Regulator of chromosome condensation domain-containing protein n=1 Tax=Eimeria tenella TaxID=5802 RepID=U6L3W8_EIMTE|nr:hypothetical protein, conserved [Eimeria tenella]CDJ43319.1 hypothetical protein, conserved [Eimeria tenella]|eukprot:XP_013234069.1 hypothetical protein, conserved [Eimeria tenella]